MRKFAVINVIVFALGIAASAQVVPVDDDQVPVSYVQTATPGPIHGNSSAAGGVLSRRSTGGVLGVDSLPNWSSYFYEPGLDSNGFLQFSWPYTMVGGSPFSQRRGSEDWEEGRTTKIGAPIIPVNLDLRDANGNPRIVMGHALFFDATGFVDPVLKSPVFASSPYTSSSDPTQFGDAIQRAEFFKYADDDWHTKLRGRVAPARTIVIRQSAAPPFVYRFARYPDGTPAYALVDETVFLNALFPPTPTDTSTVMGAVENAHQITTADLSTFLFNNTYLFGSFGCCVLGFHSYDLEPGDASNGWRERRYVMDYSSWISPGLFRGGLADVTALSHEVAETFNDPFVNNITPWWLAPNGNCQNDLETGDVIEGLPNAIIPITTNGFTYHPQNEALLQWFAGVTPSSAIHHAYSYPDITVLTAASNPQNRNCKP